MAALELIRKEPERRERLRASSHFLREELKKTYPSESKLLQGPDTPILPFWMGRAERAMVVAGKLKDRGVHAPAIRPPTVPKDECRLRFSLCSEHTPADIQALLNHLREVTL